MWIDSGIVNQMYPTEDSPVCGFNPFHRQIQCKQFRSNCWFSSVFCAYRLRLIVSAKALRGSHWLRHNLCSTDPEDCRWWRSVSPLLGDCLLRLVPAFRDTERGAPHHFSVVLVAMCSGPILPWNPSSGHTAPFCRISLTDIPNPPAAYTGIHDDEKLWKNQGNTVGRCRFYSPFTQHTGNHNIVASLFLGVICLPPSSCCWPRPVGRSERDREFLLVWLHPSNWDWIASNSVLKQFYRVTRQNILTDIHQ